MVEWNNIKRYENWMRLLLEILKFVKELTNCPVDQLRWHQRTFHTCILTLDAFNNYSFLLVTKMLFNNGTGTDVNTKLNKKLPYHSQGKGQNRLHRLHLWLCHSMSDFSVCSAFDPCSTQMPCSSYPFHTVLHTQALAIHVRGDNMLRAP